MRNEQFIPLRNDTYLILPYLLQLEAMIAAAIEAHVAKPNLMKLDGFSFDAKIKVAAGLGVLDERYVSACSALSRLRNKIAHQLDYEFTKGDASKVRKHLPDFVAKEAENALVEFLKKADAPSDTRFQEIFFIQFVCGNLTGRIGEIGNIFYGMKGKLGEMQYASLHYMLSRRNLDVVMYEPENTITLNPKRS